MQNYDDPREAINVAANNLDEFRLAIHTNLFSKRVLVFGRAPKESNCCRSRMVAELKKRSKIVFVTVADGQFQRK